MTKIVVDEKISLKHKLSLAEVLVALTVKTGDYDIVMRNLVNRGIITENNGKQAISPEWNPVIEKILFDSSGGVDEKRLKALAEKMMKCFPEGKMPGTAFYYRCNRYEVMTKMKKFFSKYGNYDDDKILDATKRFVASFQGNYKFLPLIKYFISKNKHIMDEDGDTHVTEVSELASYLENKEDIEVNNNDDWLLDARN